MKKSFLILIFLLKSFNVIAFQTDIKEKAQSTASQSMSEGIPTFQEEVQQEESLESINKKITDIIEQLSSETKVRDIYILLKNLMKNVDAYQTKSPLKEELSNQIEKIKKDIFKCAYDTLIIHIKTATTHAQKLDAKLSNAFWREEYLDYKKQFDKIITLTFSEVFTYLYTAHENKEQKESLKTHIDKLLLLQSRLLIKIEQEIRKKNFAHFSLYMELSRDYDYIQNFAHNIGMYKTKSDNTKKRKELYDFRQQFN